MKTNNAVKTTLACLIAAVAMRGAFKAWCCYERTRQQPIAAAEAEHAEWTRSAPTRPNTGDALAHEFTYRINADMPRDAVELSPEQAWAASDFYDEPPAVHPPNVPATFVAVQVFQRNDDQWRFIGWIFLDADEVNALHGKMPAI
jgi:hypothetical protein